jgi:hypothetical protein
MDEPELPWLTYPHGDPENYRAVYQAPDEVWGSLPLFAEQCRHLLVRCLYLLLSLRL